MSAGVNPDPKIDPKISPCQPLREIGQHDRSAHRQTVRKMTTRYIGILYYRLPASVRRNSVLSVSILSVDDLDCIGEEF